MSFKTEIKVSGEFYPNAVVFATTEEATAYGKHKFSTWMMAEGYRVVESTDVVNYQWTGGALGPVPAVPTEPRIVLYYDGLGE
jgi:hypothetical protein